MTGAQGNMNKMFRWLRDRKKAKGDKKHNTSDDENDYGFRKKHIILQETENGHSVIIRDNGTTLVYPQSFCKLNYRARMPTPTQTYRETSSHIYDEIPELPARRRIEMNANGHGVDILKDTYDKCDTNVDFKNAIEVGPYLIVPIVNSTNSRDVEIFKKNEIPTEADLILENQPSRQCECSTTCRCSETPDLCSQWNNSRVQNMDVENTDTNAVKDTKVVLTRCVKSKADFLVSDTTKDMSKSTNHDSNNMCSFNNGAFNSNIQLRSLLDSPGSDSNSRTLTGTPESTARTPDTLSERPNSCAISDDTIPEDTDAVVPNTVDVVDVSNIVSNRRCTNDCDGDDTCCEYDVSTSGESDISVGSDYELYLSKIENNLKLKRDVRKMLTGIDNIIPESDEDAVVNTDDLETMTYVSSLSECSSAPSHVSDVSADRSSSDDSGGYYECTEEIQQGSRDRKHESRAVHLERSVSAPVSSPTHVKKVFKINHKLNKDKALKSKKSSQSSRSNSFDCNFYKALSDEDKEMYLFPSSKQSDRSTSSSGSRHSRNKPVLTPQPTPIYMEPYRGKSRSHNRLLGDLIRMNYDKQLFIH